MSYIQPVIDAFLQRRPGKINNTESTGQELLLFGNKIAWWEDHDLWITDATWRSNTTRDRLNMLPGVKLSIRKREWTLQIFDYSTDTLKETKQWNGKPIKINL